MKLEHDSLFVCSKMKKEITSVTKSIAGYKTFPKIADNILAEKQQKFKIIMDKY